MCAPPIWACCLTKPSADAAPRTPSPIPPASYKTDIGLVPYVTNAKSAAIEIGQAGQVMTSLLAGDDWLSNSFLNEAGVKFTPLDNHLMGALAWYRQETQPVVAKPGRRQPGRHTLSRR